MIKTLHPYRFQLYFYSQLSILFGSLIIPVEFFDETLIHLLLLINIFFGILVVYEYKLRVRLYSIILLFLTLIYMYSMKYAEIEMINYFKLLLYSVFYVSVTIGIIRQVWHTEHVTQKTIIGLMSGYIALGFVFFFVFSSIELFNKDSFLLLHIDNTGINSSVNSLLYFSYVTLMTLGYGDIVPLTEVAQKATILCGLTGQFYLVIITAIIVGKYLKHNMIDDNR